MAKRDQPTICNFRYYKNETKSGKGTHAKARKSVLYYDNRFDLVGLQEVQRGTWLSRDGVCPAHEVMQWATEESPKHLYTYTLLLSVKEGRLSAENFQQALESAGEQVGDYRMIAHEDTGHAHAHVMLFRDKTYTKKAFNQIKRHVQKTLAQLERVQLLEQKQDKKIVKERSKDMARSYEHNNDP